MIKFGSVELGLVLGRGLGWVVGLVVLKKHTQIKQLTAICLPERYWLNLSERMLRKTRQARTMDWAASLRISSALSSSNCRRLFIFCFKVCTCSLACSTEPSVSASEVAVLGSGVGFSFALLSLLLGRRGSSQVEARVALSTKN